MPNTKFEAVGSDVWWMSEGAVWWPVTPGLWPLRISLRCNDFTQSKHLHRGLQALLGRDGGSMGGTDTSHIWAPKCLSMSFSLRSPGDKAGASAQHMCGQLCRVRTAVCILHVVLTWLSVMGMLPVARERMALTLYLLILILNSKGKWNFSCQWVIRWW